MDAAERITVAFELAAERELGGGDGDCWCVDNGKLIDCMTTRQVWMALAQGRIEPRTPVWRDGFGHWTAIHEVAELTYDDDDYDDQRITVPEHSEIRVRTSRGCGVAPRPERSSQPPVARRHAPVRLGRAALAIARRRPWLFALAGVALGVVAALGISLAHTAWRRHHLPMPRAHRVAVDVAERARFVSAQARARSVEREHAWWHDRWK